MLLLFVLSLSLPYGMLGAQLPSNISNYQLYLCAQYSQLHNDLTKSEDFYQKLFANKAPNHIYPGYVTYLAQSQNHKMIISLLPTLSNGIQKRSDMTLILAQAYEHEGQPSKSGVLFRQLHDEHPTNIEFAYYAALSYIRDAQFDKALRLIDSFIETNATSHKHFIFHFLKAQIFLNMNEKQEALKHLKQCIALMPTFDQGWLLYGVIHEMAQNSEMAIEGYRHYLQLVGSNKTVEQHLAALMMKKQKKNIIVENEALYYFQNQQYEKALEMVDKELKTATNLLSNQILKIEILCSLKKEKKALAQLKEWIVKDPSNEQLYKLVHLLYFAGLDSKNIISMLQELEKKIQDYSFSTLYLADLYLRLKEQDKALHSLESLLQISLSNDLKSKTLYQCALIYYQKGMHKKVKNYLEQAYSLDSAFDPTLNLLAYYYATKENNYSKAQEFIAKALTNQPNNPHYLDTQGMIWYKRKEYDKAQLSLLHATQLLPNDPCILKHLGKILFEMGNIVEAKNAFDKAHLLVTTQKKKNSVQGWLQKINQTLLYSAK